LPHEKIGQPWEIPNPHRVAVLQQGIRGRVRVLRIGGGWTHGKWKKNSGHRGRPIVGRRKTVVTGAPFGEGLTAGYSQKQAGQNAEKAAG